MLTDVSTDFSAFTLKLTRPESGANTMKSALEGSLYSWQKPDLHKFCFCGISHFCFHRPTFPVISFPLARPTDVTPLPCLYCAANQYGGKHVKPAVAAVSIPKTKDNKKCKDGGSSLLRNLDTNSSCAV
jgi:hypothetical protein